MNIFITGGAGFIGANLAFYFKELNHNVIVLDNLVRRGSELNLESFKKKGITFIHGDVRNKEDLEQLKVIPDVILECSAQPSAVDGYDNPYFDINNNTIGLINILEYARKFKSAVIFWSTNKVYSGDKINSLPMKCNETRWFWKNHIKDIDGFEYPYGIDNNFSIDGGQHSIYGLSKVMSDLACQEYYDAFGVKTVVNRFSCLAGQGQFGKCAQGWVAWWAIAAMFNLPVKYIGWNGKQVRDVLFIDDICKLIELEIENIDVISGEAFNIGGGMNYTLSLIEATSLMEEMTGNKMTVSYDSTHRKADHCIYISDIRKIKTYLGWKPETTIIDGYSKIIEWVKNNEAKLKQLID